MRRLAPTPKQQRVLDYLRAHPDWTYRDVQEAMGYRYANSVTQNLKALEKQGWLCQTEVGFVLSDEPTTYGAALAENRRLRALVERLAAVGAGEVTP